jgi:hypothetical protein
MLLAFIAAFVGLIMISMFAPPRPKPPTAPAQPTKSGA